MFAHSALLFKDQRRIEEQCLFALLFMIWRTLEKFLEIFEVAPKSLGKSDSQNTFLY